MTRELVPAANTQLVEASGVPALLQKIRPHWQAKSLIERVHRLVHVDPSSACQRIFNAAIHDLREKIVVAGLDIAREAAEQNKLPPVAKEEDIENYSTAKLIDLSYRMGLLTRPEWRRVCRSYEIRRDLEHEDDEYVAGVEDCVYIFSTCVDVILSKDPITLLRVTDVKEVVEQASAATPNDALLEDFEQAPVPRQIEILKFLVSNALDKRQSDIIQQNAFNFLNLIRPRANKQTILSISQDFQNRVGRSGLDQRHARVATAAGAMLYLRQTARRELFGAYGARLDEVGMRWTSHAFHGEILREFPEIGGFAACPEELRLNIFRWMLFTYLGEPGGQTSYGNIRHVFYSNAAAPLIENVVRAEATLCEPILRGLTSDKNVQKLCSNAHIARRYEKLLDCCTIS